jgi:hypothetical protein
VSATNRPATAFSRRTQPNTFKVLPFPGSPISKTPVFLSAADSLGFQGF